MGLPNIYLAAVLEYLAAEVNGIPTRALQLNPVFCFYLILQRRIISEVLIRFACFE